MPIIAKVVGSNPAHGEVYSMQHYVIKFVSDLRRSGFLRVQRVSSIQHYVIKFVSDLRRSMVFSGYTGRWFSPGTQVGSFLRVHRSVVFSGYTGRWFSPGTQVSGFLRVHQVSSTNKTDLQI